MPKSIVRFIGIAGMAAGFTLSAAGFPGPAVDENRSEKGSETAIFARGCFWGVEAVFDVVKGVSDAVADTRVATRPPRITKS